MLVLFGLMQVFSGLWYRMPMPVQPLKAFAALVIAQKIPGRVIFGGGLAIGVSMFFLSVTGLIDALARLVPKAVVRGIQFGLALQLATLALKQYVPADGLPGYALAAGAFLIIVVLLGNRRWPAALLVIALGVAYSLVFKLDLATAQRAAGVHLPGWHIPASADILTGALLLALPQIPLSLGNSVLATRQIAADYFPERRLSVRQISLTYALMNLVSPFLGGFPVCHGSGGMVGHYAFGARTGGSVIIYGALFLTLGLFFSQGFQQVVQIFPLPILGVLLLFEALTLATLLRDISGSRAELLVALLVGLLCAGLPYGYLVGLVVGTGVYYAMQRGWVGLGR
ncbi:MAG: putative sulfate/molybdate transporter [Hymenobacter sp.]